MRMRKKKHLQDRLDRCSAVTIENPVSLRGNWRSLFPEADSLYIELGCGKGRFSAEMAKQNPTVLYIALEKEPNAIMMAMERAIREEIPNLYFIKGDAGDLPSMFAPGEADRLFINFCDPWTRSRKAHRRLTYRDFLNQYAQVVKPGAHLCMKTDNVALFTFSLEEVNEFGLHLIDVTHDLHATSIPNIMTEYEERFTGQGIKIQRLEAVFPENVIADCLAHPIAMPKIPVLPHDTEDTDTPEDAADEKEES